MGFFGDDVDPSEADAHAKLNARIDALLEVVKHQAEDIESLKAAAHIGTPAAAKVADVSPPASSVVGPVVAAQAAQSSAKVGWAGVRISGRHRW